MDLKFFILDWNSENDKCRLAVAVQSVDDLCQRVFFFLNYLFKSICTSIQGSNIVKKTAQDHKIADFELNILA